MFISFANDDDDDAAVAAFASAATYVIRFACCHCRFCLFLLLFVFIGWQTTDKHAPHFARLLSKCSAKKITFNTRVYQLIATTPTIELN